MVPLACLAWLAGKPAAMGILSRPSKGLPACLKEGFQRGVLVGCCVAQADKLGPDWRGLRFRAFIAKYLILNIKVFCRRLAQDGTLLIY